MCVRVMFADGVGMVMSVLLVQMNIELYTLDAGLSPSRNVQVIVIQPQLCQLALQPFCIDPQIEQSADEHVPADSAKDVEI